MYYIRKVKYLDYMEDGERKGSAGFVKLEVRGEHCNITLNVNGTDRILVSEAKVYLISADKVKELCDLKLQSGRGMKQLFGESVQNIGNTGISYAELEAIHIPLSKGNEIYGVLEETENIRMDSAVATDPVEAPVGQVNLPEIRQVELSAGPQKTPVQTPPETPPEPLPVESSKVQWAEGEVRLCDNKWEQLWEIYPHIAPFQDDREYLSITPGDFVIFSVKYFRMVNNSFLLHGFYNYRHLILKKMEQRGEEKYYIGVPGNFYDREKQVAVMFGFESFESQEDSAETGDYGYYLMRIEL